MKSIDLAKDIRTHLAYGKRPIDLPDLLGVTKQRISQVMKKHGIARPAREKKERVKKLLPPLERILSKSKMADSGCIEYGGYVDGNGYGKLTVSGKKTYAHRAVFELTTGTSPICVLHTCDNRKCVNIEHLRAGNHLENMQDRKNRTPKDDWNARFTKEKAIAALILHGEHGVSQVEIAKMNGVNQTVVNRAIKRLTAA